MPGVSPPHDEGKKNAGVSSPRDEVPSTGSRQALTEMQVTLPQLTMVRKWANLHPWRWLWRVRL